MQNLRGSAGLIMFVEREFAGGVEMVGQESCPLTQWFAYVCAGEQVIEAVSSGTVDGSQCQGRSVYCDAGDAQRRRREDCECHARSDAVVVAALSRDRPQCEAVCQINRAGVSRALELFKRERGFF